MYEVHVLKEGYSMPGEEGSHKSAGTITLVKGPQNIIVDTGSPWDRQLIIDGLDKHGLIPDQVGFVVCSHGHSDHIGNNNLFSKAVHIVCHDVCQGEKYMLHHFHQGIPYEIDDLVEVIPTPGHTGRDVSVVVKGTNKGTVVIAGDLFECFEDLDDPLIWIENSERPKEQEVSRKDVLQIADHIIPGHGPMFKVPDLYKSQFRVVYYEEHSESNEGITESSEYLVYEELGD